MADLLPLPRSSLLTSKPLHLIVLLLLAMLLLLLGLGELGLTDRDEGSNAEAAREMLETGDWISPTLNYEPRYAKPAFVYWVISGTYALLGINEFTARLPSALFGMGLILLQYLFTARILGAPIALLAALILLLNLETIGICRLVLTDPELVFFTTLSTWSFWLGFNGKEDRDRAFFWLFYLGMGFAMLAKGPIGIILPLLAVIPYLSITGQWKRYWTNGHPLLGTILFLVIAAPWYLAMFAIHGADYAAAAQANTTGRFASPMEGHGGTLLFYVPVLLLGFFPWSGFLPMALCQAWTQWRESKKEMVRPEQSTPVIHQPEAVSLDPLQDQYDSNPFRPEANQTLVRELSLFLGLWIVAIFVFFTLSATRLPHYIFPLYPAASILVAVFFSRCLHQPSPSGLRLSVGIMLTIGYIFGLTLATLPAFYEAFLDKIARNFPAAAQVDPGYTPIVTGTLIIACVMAIRHYALDESGRPTAFWVGCVMVVSLVLMIVIFALPRFNTYFIAPPQELAVIAGLNLGPEDRLIQFGRKRPSLIFYAKRKVYHINPGEDEKFLPHLTGPGRTMIVVQSNLRSRLPDPVADFPVVLQRHGFSLLANEPMIKGVSP